VKRKPLARPVVFGEVLMDMFPDGTEILGGAPFNVAWHLAAFGLKPLFVSAVGDDAKGRAVLRRMESWGMDTAGVQTDPSHPTGEVRVTIERNEPRYEILPDRAYDFIAPGMVREVLRGVTPSMIVHGTLAVRNEISAGSLAWLMEETGAPAFMDVNLRPPWYVPSLVSMLMRRARWVKLNTSELGEIAGFEGEDEARTRKLLKDYDLSEVVLTRGADGAVSISAGNDSIAEKGDPSDPFTDSVGAGDAFSAVTVAGLLGGWSTGTRMKRAVRLASALCGLRGAVPQDRVWYDPFLSEWGQSGKDSIPG
jgi:fructokinase